MNTLLIIEDDKTLREGLLAALASKTLETSAAADLASARKAVDNMMPDLVLLDCNLPDGNGIDFCRNVLTPRGIPVIFLTVRDSELDEVGAFKAGAVDYIKKPFLLMVLRERINAALSRARIGRVYADGRFEFDFENMRFFSAGNPVILSLTEQKLLAELIKHKHQIVPRTALVSRIWECPDEYVDENALSVTVRRLRAKLTPECIRTVYGLGYMWAGDES